MKSGSKILVTFCLIFVLGLLPGNVNFAAAEGEVVTPEFQSKVKELKDNSGILDGFLIGQAENLFYIKGINSIQNLIFGNPYQVWMDGDGKTETVHYGLFYDKEWNDVIKPLINFFSASYVGFVTLSILIACLKFGLKAYSPQAKADFWTDINMWVLSAFFMGTFGLISEIMFGLNEGITQGLKELLISKGVDVGGLSIIAFADGFTVGDIFVFLAEWGLALYLNIVYIARKIIILLLLILAPVAAISLLYAKTRSFFGSWIKELAGNVFLQSIHAVVIGVFAGLATLGAGTIFKLGCIIMFIPVTGLVSKWLQLGDSSTALGRTTTMLGLGGVAGAMMLARSAGSVVKGGKAGGSAVGGGFGDLSSDTSGTNISEGATGSNSKGWQFAKKAVGVAGGVAGATMGLPFGAGGVAAGGLIGSKAAQFVTQGTRNLTSGGMNFGRTLARTPMEYSGADPGKKWNFSDYKRGTQAMWGNLAARRQFMGNLGESLGSVVGSGEMGRSIGQMASGVSRNRIQKEQFGGKTLDDYAKERPGANVEWRQTNQGSAFYMDHGNGEWRQISAFGAADSSLKRGEVRSVGYKLNDGTPWVRQENGTFISKPTNNSATNGSTTSQTQDRQLVGLSGSTSHLGRTSGVQIVGADGKRYEDPRVEAKNINPDQYFSHNVAGASARRSTTDKGADLVHGSAKRAQPVLSQFNSWRTNSVMNKKNNRHSGVV
ncbi:hypothetical protein [Ammoniphilus resinae]|uniref:Uncharacterized protein n=1 Tax=Ammoniphilus resinae TaxID=861532 RepID=A0ABS4GP32_9BACL|nr:hypothetical protein [Ammoniphilus resinae]MBP1932029.1 hypothetical protein [Ammoniphilus resinae]